jgi:DNA repair protein RecN (Recombination protein N)
MLKHLLIKNYALIEHLEMAPSPRLNMITGETGAGKSIMLGAVGLLLGNRADTKSLYNENEKCVVEGSFDVSAYKLAPLFEENELDYEAVTLIRREISPSGKSRAFVNDTPVTLDVLKSLGDHLMDIHSQHDTLLLASNKFQLGVIDAYAGSQPLIDSYVGFFKSFRKKKKAYDQLVTESTELQKEAEYNLFLYTELEKAALKADEQQQLEDELATLEHAEEIKLRLNESLQLLSEAEFSIESQLAQVTHALSAAGKFSGKINALRERLESAVIELQDIGEEIKKEDDQIEYDPEKIQLTKERVDLINQLQQKHRAASIEELLVIQQNLEAKVRLVQNMDDTLTDAKNELDEAEKELALAATKLSEHRKTAFPGFSKAVVEIVRELGMPLGSFEVSHKLVPPTESGVDEIGFLFSANKGITPRELKDVASGGEFSRLMFAIKYILTDKTALPTIIFDEIDTGISGEIANKMVGMMKTMAMKHQVISISHLPQFAARGDAHYFVYKDNSSDKAVSKVKLLEEEERVNEIAKMIAGASPTASALQNARELLQQD